MNLNKLGNFLNIFISFCKQIYFKIKNYLKLIIIFSLLFFAPYIFFYLGNVYFGSPFYNRSYAQLFYHSSKFFSSITLRQDIQLVNYQLSRVYFVNGDLRSALYYIDIEIKNFPEYKRSHYIRGLTLGYMDRQVEAIEEFKQFNSADQHKNTWAGHNDQAWLEYEIGKYKDAVKTIEEVLPDNNSNPWLLNTYGAALIKLNDCDYAAQALSAAKINVEALTPEVWGIAYPGNNPNYYGLGLQEMKDIIDDNLTKANLCKTGI